MIVSGFASRLVTFNEFAPVISFAIFAGDAPNVRTRADVGSISVVFAKDETENARTESNKRFLTIKELLKGGAERGTEVAFILRSCVCM
jgi:hypothetical protein